MNTIECIKQRRTIRSFTDRKVDRKIIEQIIEAASMAPSWKNTQITRYIVVEDENLKNKIANECCPEYNEKNILSAPILVATTIVKKRSGYERDGSYSTTKESGWEMYDCGIASQTFSLAAWELGVGSVIMGIFDYEKVSQLLQVPEGQEIVALIALGYPNVVPQPPKKKTVADLVTYR